MDGIDDLPNEMIAEIANCSQDNGALGALSVASRRMSTNLEPILRGRMSFFANRMPIRNAAVFERNAYDGITAGGEEESKNQYMSWLLDFFTHLAKAPHMAEYVQQIHVNLIDSSLASNTCWAEDPALLELGQRILDNQGLGNDKIEHWNSPDGWTALLLLVARNVTAVHIAGDLGDEYAMPRTRDLAQLVSSGLIHTCLTKLHSVRLFNSSPYPFAPSLNSLWWWSALPSVMDFGLRNFEDESVFGMAYPAMTKRLEKLTLETTNAGPNVLEEIITHTTGISTLRYVNTSRFESRVGVLPSPNVQAYMAPINRICVAIDKLRLEFPCGRDLAARALSDEGITREPAPDGHPPRPDSSLPRDQAGELFIGSLLGFTKLRSLITRSYMVFNDSVGCAFIDQFPPTLRKLQIRDDCAQSRGFEGALTMLVCARTTFGDRYPALTQLKMPFRAVGQELIDACNSNSILLICLNYNAVLCH